jgi:uncharacterized membrane protein YfcA
MDIGSVLGLEQLTWGTLILVIVAAFAAGWIDAVVGGGGLLQLPALLLIPGISPIQALATNKLASVFGTATSSVTYYRRAKPDIRTALPMAAIALLGSFSGHKHHLMAGLAGLVIGFYDGLIGPGTGTFLVISLVALLGYDFLQASAKAKIVNLATNTGALLLFIPHGAVLWLLGGILAVANVAGSYLGSRMAISKGTTFIRVVFLVVVVALIAKLGVDVWNENIAPALAQIGR